MIPVPASFADFYTDKELRDFCGDVWYETSFFVPGELQGSIVELRFGAVAHRAAVGFVKRAGTAMFTAAGSGKRPESFFASPTVARLKQNHLEALKEMIQRDKNHACVIAWSLFNEPESNTVQAGEYFA